MVPVRSPLKLVSSMATNARGHVTDGWAGVVEEVIQHTVEARLDRDGRRDNPPEVFAFIQAIDQLIGDRSKRARKEGGGIEASRELEWFAQPCEHMFVFRLSRRQYVSRAYRPDVDRPRGAEDDRETAVDVATRLNKGIGLVPPEAIPSSRELIATLLAHVASGGPHVVRKDSSEQQSFPELPLHSARRSAILNWQRRLEDLYRRRFAHEEGIAPEYAFPYVGIEIFDGEYLALVLVAPMDENFIDDKVPADSRACEIGLAFYRLERQVDPDALQAATALLREGFAHALFHLRTEQNRNVVVGSFGEVAKITRHWYQNASLYSILGDEASRDRFDPVRFCEALVHKLLCSVEGVNEREVYPFDRVYIFREAGTTTELTREPIEMWVLEASIKSEDPDDLGAYLTRRERTTRDTAEYRCRKSQKMIEAKNTHRFFLQCSSHERAADRLFLSKSASVTDVEMENAELQSNSRSMGSKAIDLSDHEVYRIDVGEDDDEKTLSMALYNLLAGKITRARTKEREQGMRVEVQEADALSDDFWEDTRLAVNQRADQHGLYFEYEHGLDLSVDVPLLDRLQKAYFRFLKDRARLDDDEYEKLTLRKSNFAPKQIEDIRARRRSEKREAARDASQTESGNSKVVYISFSSELHDENNRLVLEEQRASRRDKHRNNDSAEAEVPPILGPEYAFTMVFVSDNEPEKTRPDLQREKEDLRTVISMIIRQVWADKLKERRYLERRSKSIGECLSGFLHRAKGYIKDPRQKAEVDALHNGLQKLIAPERGHAEWQSFTSAEQVLWRMMTGESIEGVTEAAVGERLQSMAHDSVGEGAVRLAGVGLYRAGPMAPARALWLDVVIQDAFRVLFDNACQAAVGRAAHSPPFVSVRVDVAPLVRTADEARGFVDVIVENSGGPIEQSRLESLNAPEPRRVNQDRHKEGSTGIGLYVSRTLLRDRVRRGADMADIIVQNVGADRVQTRLRVPARMVSTEQVVQGPIVRRPLGDYVLYVEDDRAHVEATAPKLREYLTTRGLELVHYRGAEEAISQINARLPVLLLCDLTILPSEKDQIPTQPQGLAVVEAFAKQAGGDVNARPPIWIVSADATASSVRSKVADTAPAYRVIPQVPSTPLDGVGSATISFLDGKRPFEDPAFEGMLDGLMKAYLLGRHVETAVVGPPVGVHLKGLQLNSPTFASDLGLAVDRQAQPDAKELLVVVSASARDRVEFTKVLSQWFRHPSLPEPSSRRRADRVYALTDHPYHDRLLLVVEVDATLAASLPVTLAYWLMSRNVWVTSTPLNDGHIYRTWRHAISEDCGPLSRLRHDLRNEWAGPALRERLHDAEKRIAECTERLRLGDVEQPLQAALVGGEPAPIVAGLLVGGSDRRAAAIAALRGLQEAIANTMRELPDDRRGGAVDAVQVVAAVRTILGEVV